jgi:hypothetical protein
MFLMPGLVNDDDYRSSIAVMAGPEVDVSAAFQLYRGDEGPVTTLQSHVIRAGSVRQWALDNLFPDEGRPGQPMTVKAVLSQPAIVFATVVDNVSTDSVVFLEQNPATSWIIPVVAHTRGENQTLWSSTVTLWNSSAGVTNIELEFLPENTDNSSGGLVAAPVMLGGHVTLALQDVLSTLFGVPEGKGALLARATNPIAVTSRVWTAAARGGTSGSGVRTVHASALSSGEVLLPGVRMLGGFRTNVGFVTGDRAATLLVRLRGPGGLQLAERVLEVPPRSLRQVPMASLFGSSVPKPDPVGSLVVSSPVEFLAYLTVIDGTSQDPVFVMSR